MGAAFEVYNQIGYGLAEEVYQQSLEIELGLRDIPFATKQQLDVFYKGHQLTTCYVPDLLVFGGIVVELKAVTGLMPSTTLSCSTTCASLGRSWGICSTSVT